ncbi:hypothetical protein SDC9_153646 [bioreactor metagenome]|uniref:Uncharacterized protein n=1 Tax=bioreactor metagenome TaxID=1076179 RepID=A0A645EY40_9ZZZZ|nr:hypothetical protein [Candidatus Pelethousia sp.]NCB30085.1 hypothetical protein [Clostridia bacterium]
MKLWATIRDSNHRILRETMVEADYRKREQVEDWLPILGQACQVLDLARPILLKKHLHDLNRYSRTVFKPEDFMEPVDFKHLEVEAFFEKQKEENRQ